MSSRRLPLLTLMALPACAGGAPTMPMPDYDGPAVVARPHGAGGLRLEMVAPMAGYSLTLEGVTEREELAEVRLHYQMLDGDFFAQQLTPLAVDVPAELLGAARAVAVLVRDGEAEPRLALTTSRPRR